LLGATGAAGFDGVVAALVARAGEGALGAAAGAREESLVVLTWGSFDAVSGVVRSRTAVLPEVCASVVPLE
jgi:hypothetical protein